MKTNTSALEIVGPALEKALDCLTNFYNSKLETKTTDNASAYEALDWDELTILAAVLDGLKHYVETVTA